MERGGIVLAIIEPCGDDDDVLQFQMHEELTWDYDSVADTRAEEMVCGCGAASCRRLMVCWQSRCKPVQVYDAQGRRVAAERWPAFLKELASSAQQA